MGKIIYDCVSRIEKNQESLSHIKHLIVDEFQDIDTAQFKLIKAISSCANLFVVGDPRQTIYKWRGSNENFFNMLDKIFPDIQTVNIRENRRSGRKIVEISNIFADTIDNGVYKHMISTKGDDGIVEFVVFETPEDEAKWIIDQIDKLHQKGLKYSDIAILLRSVRTSAEPFIMEMKNKKIPFIVGGKVGLFKRGDALAVGMLMAWLNEDSFWQIDNNIIYGDDLKEFAIDAWNNPAH